MHKILVEHVVDTAIDCEVIHLRCEHCGHKWSEVVPPEHTDYKLLYEEMKQRYKLLEARHTKTTQAMIAQSNKYSDLSDTIRHMNDEINDQHREDIHDALFWEKKHV